MTGLQNCQEFVFKTISYEHAHLQLRPSMVKLELLYYDKNFSFSGDITFLQYQGNYSGAESNSLRYCKMMPAEKQIIEYPQLKLGHLPNPYGRESLVSLSATSECHWEPRRWSDKLMAVRNYCPGESFCAGTHYYLARWKCCWKSVLRWKKSIKPLMQACNGGNDIQILSVRWQKHGSACSIRWANMSSHRLGLHASGRMIWNGWHLKRAGRTNPEAKSKPGQYR